MGFDKRTCSRGGGGGRRRRKKEKKRKKEEKEEKGELHQLMVARSEWCG